MNSITSPQNTITNDSIEHILQTSKTYFSNNITALSTDTLQELQRDIGYILTSNGSPFSIDVKEKTITLSENTDRSTIMIVRQGRKTWFKQALESFTQQHTALVPTFFEHSNFPIDSISTEQIIYRLCDIISLLNISERLQHKKWVQKKPWQFIYKNIAYPYNLASKKPFSNTKGLEKQTKQHTIQILESDNQLWSLIHDINDAITYINKSTLPFHISTSNHTIKLKTKSIRSFWDLLPPQKYTVEYADMTAPLSDIIKVCIKKRPNYFNQLQQFLSQTAQYEQSIQHMYKKFLEWLIMVYVWKKGTTLKLVDTQEKELHWIGTISIKKSSMQQNKTTLQDAHKNNHIDITTTQHRTRKKLINNEETINTIVTKDMFQNLWYDKWFSTKLFTFCCKEILKTTDIDFNVWTLISYRKSLPPMQIAQLHRDNHYKYCIRALDRILDEFLASSNDTHAEWTKKWHV